MRTEKGNTVLHPLPRESSRTMAFEQKIIVRNKSRYFDVAAVKHHSQHTRSWLQCKWEAFCENYLPYLLCARDKLLQKHL